MWRTPNSCNGELGNSDLLTTKKPRDMSTGQGRADMIVKNY